MSDLLISPANELPANELPVNESPERSSFHSQITLFNLPNEIIDKIFRFMPFEMIAKQRIVCRRFNQIGSFILNQEFKSFRNKTHLRFQTIKAQMPRRESARRKHPLARECDIIETLHMRLTLLQMTFGKHIERKHCCFFAGEILDEVRDILTYINETPKLGRSYVVTDELFDLSTMAMEYFKEFIEPTLPEINYFGIDLFEYSPALSNAPLKLSLMEGSSGNGHHSKASKSNPKSAGSALSSNCVANDGAALNRKLNLIKVNVKRSNVQISILKRELRSTKKKVSQQQRLIHNLRARFCDYDKKFETTTRKLSAVLEELSKCKTELQYWRSKSPQNAPLSNGKANPCKCNNTLANSSFQSPDTFQPIMAHDNSDNFVPNELSPQGTSHTLKFEDSDLPFVRRFCKRKLEYSDTTESEPKKLLH